MPPPAVSVITQVQALIKAAAIASPTLVAKVAPDPATNHVQEGITEELAADYSGKFPLVEIGQVTLNVRREAIGLHFGTATCFIRFWELVDSTISTSHSSVVDFADKVIQDMDLNAAFQPGFLSRFIDAPNRSQVFHNEADPKKSWVWVDATVEVEVMVPGDP